jgi:hypothetical protein
MCQEVEINRGAEQTEGGLHQDLARRATFRAVSDSGFIHGDGEIPSPPLSFRSPGNAGSRERTTRGTHERLLLFRTASRKGEEEKMSCRLRSRLAGP